MSSGHEALLGLAFIQATLATDASIIANAPGGVWRSLAPPGTVPPFVVMSYHAGSDVITMNGFRMIVEAIFQVKCAGPSSMTATIAAAAERFDVLLGGPPGKPASGPVVINGVTVGQVLACWREQPLVLDELVDGELWTNAGGLYKMQIEQTS